MKAFDRLIFEPRYVVQVDGRQDGLFHAHKGRRLITADRNAGSTPFVAGSRMNNSITDFSDGVPQFPGGWLTLIYNGDGGTGHAKYQPAPFNASDDVIVLEPLSAEATPSALLLIASMLTQQCVPKFGFGYKLTLHRLGRQKIMVPVVVEAGEHLIDWAGMTLLGDEIMRTAAANASRVYHSNSLTDDTLPELNYEPMLIPDVFESMKSSGAWYDKSKLAPQGEGQYPFVSRTRANNGVDGTCFRQARDPEPGNALTIALDTQVVAYQPVPFYTSQNIQVLRHSLLDEESAMVLVSIINEQMGKFSWGGNGATLGRLRKTRIMVPMVINEDGDKAVDWDGMRRYGRAVRLRTERASEAVVA